MELNQEFGICHGSLCIDAQYLCQWMGVHKMLNSNSI